MPEIGLHNFKNRFYHADLGRFLQNDPIRFDGGDLNLYRYVWNSPSNFSDPTGEVVLVDDAIILAVVGGVAVAAYLASPQGQSDMRAAGEAMKGLWERSASGLKSEESPRVPIYINPERWPGSGGHGARAREKEGVKSTGVISRGDKAKRSRENLKDFPTAEGMDRDEYPPAIIKPDGDVDVELVPFGDNRGAGGSIGQQTKGLIDGTPVIVVPEVPPPPPPPSANGPR